MTVKKKPNQSFLRTSALTSLLAGTVGSLYFMLNGRNQKSIILLGLFIVWVLSPFAGLLIANKISNRWTVPARTLLYFLMIVLTIGSLIAYSGAFIPSGTKPAFIFLVVPLTSWLFIVTVILIAWKATSTNNHIDQT